MSVIIETSIGDLTVDLYTDERPRCCLNFLKLCKVKYYNFSLFHSVQENLVAQVGDPTATGRGGESVFAQLYGEQASFFDMEVSPRIKHTKKGLISMVNNGSGMHGSQFFFTLGDDLDYLDGKHTVFGEVAEGFDILDKLNKTFCDESFRPHQDIRIYHTILLDDPYDDPDGLEIPASSPGPTQEMLDSDRIPCDADVNEDEGKTTEELTEMMAEKEAKANTQILEMVGDLPDADTAPPENVLFVCKLNPVTTSDDLEIIFSRFGQIVSCDVIKDSKTGESLQYAFVEFSDPQECENAYFKMDNVLIDDRRIHVDFSQSVSKLKWKGKGRGVEIITGGTAPSFLLKNQQRQDDRYDLVYEHDDDGGGGGDNNLKRTSNKSKEKSKKSRRRDGSEDEQDRRQQKQRKSSLSPSPDRGRRNNTDVQKSDNRRRDGREDERYRGNQRDRNDRQRNHRDEQRSRTDDRAHDNRSRRGDQDNYSSRRDERDLEKRSRPYDRDGDYRSRRDDRENYDTSQRQDSRRREYSDRREDRRKERSRSPVARNDRGRERKRSNSVSSEDNRAAQRSKKREKDVHERKKGRDISSEDDERDRSRVKSSGKDKQKNGKTQKKEKRQRDSDSSEDSSEEERKKSHKKDKKKKKKKRKASSSDDSDDNQTSRRKQSSDDSESSDESAKRKKKKKKDKSRR